MTMLMKSTPRHQYQADVREFVRGKPKVGIFSYYGAGKTYQVLQWIADMLECGDSMLPVIVLCPKNLVFQWGAQIAEHSNFTYSIVEGGIRERREALEKRVDIYIVNYGAIRTALRYDLNILAARCNTIVVDESTYIKSAETLRFKLIQYNFRTIPHRAILTGKPITEEIQNLWSQLLFLDDGARLGTSYWHFIHDHFDSDMYKPFGKVLKDGAVERLAAKISDICIYVPREKVAEQLPPREIIPVYFEMPKKTREYYRELKKNYRVEFENGVGIDTQWAFVKSAKLHQMCQGFVYTDGGTVDMACDKWDWLGDSVPQILAQGPLIIWGYHKDTVARTRALLTEMKVEHGCYVGGDDQTSVDAFKSGSLNCLVLSTSAAFAGFNLFRAKSAIFVSQALSGDMRDNALARNYRLGSEMHDSVIVYDLLTKNSVDEVIYDANNAKSNLGDSLLKYLTQEE